MRYRAVIDFEVSDDDTRLNEQRLAYLGSVTALHMKAQLVNEASVKNAVTVNFRGVRQV
jgi:hypothetical protein